MPTPAPQAPPFAINPPPASFPARCWAEVDLAALRHNVGVVRETVGPDTTILAVVKANGYGHGMVPVARALHASGEVTHFGVASLAEALHLQEGLPEARVTILSPALPDERAEIVRHGFLPWLSSLAEAEDFARHATEQDKVPFPVELKLDTGMGRMGVLEEDFDAVFPAVQRLTALRIAGLATHLPSPDEDEAFTRAQLDRVGALQARLDLPGVRFHAQNSAGLLGYARDQRHLVRPGLMLYGVSPLPAFQDRLRPVLTLKTRLTVVRTLPAGHGVSYGRTVITTRPTRVGTLAAGYADGYPRHLSNVGATVLVRGRRCPVLGRVTMDQTIIDLSAAPEAEAGEVAVLLGRQGDEEIPAAELAAKSGTIPWEIFTGLTARVIRQYLD